MIRLILLMLLVSMLGSCELNRREKALQEKEARLLVKEQELLLKEKTLALKEEELRKRELQLDSTKVDTTLKYHPALPGNWSVKMRCIETSCPGSAVGDTKSETWQISFDSSLNLIAKVVSGNNIARIYTGRFNGTAIELTEEVEVTGEAPATKIMVRLNIIDARTLDGKREILREGNCRIIYDLHIAKQEAS